MILPCEYADNNAQSMLFFIVCRDLAKDAGTAGARVYLWAQQSVREVAALRQHQQHNSPVMIVEEFQRCINLSSIRRYRMRLGYVPKLAYGTRGLVTLVDYFAH